MIDECLIIFVYHMHYEYDDLYFLVTEKSHRETNIFFGKFFFFENQNGADSDLGEGSGGGSGGSGGLGSGGEGFGTSIIQGSR